MQRTKQRLQYLYLWANANHMGIISGNLRVKKESSNDIRIEKLRKAVSGKHFHTPAHYQEESVNLFVNEFKHHSKPEVKKQNEFLIAGDICLYNKEELELKFPEINEKEDAAIVLDLFTKYNEGCLSYLIGDFAFVIYDSLSQEIFATRDQVGARPFYYSYEDGEFQFASRFRYFTENGKKDIDELWIADLLSMTISEQERCFTKDVRKLASGHFLKIKNSKLEISRYWDLKYTKRDLTEEEAIAEYKTLFNQAVITRMDSIKKIGCELSGGIDSTSVTALIQQEKKKEQTIVGFSHAMEDEDRERFFPFVDEREFIDDLLAFSGFQNQKYITAKDSGIVDSLKKELLVYGGPSLQNLQTVNDVLYEAAERHAAEVLFSGFGGDELVTSHVPGYAEELAHGFQIRKLRNFLNDEGRKSTMFCIAKKVVKSFLPEKVIKIQRKKDKSYFINEKFQRFAFSEDFAWRIDLRNRKFKIGDFPYVPNVRERQYERITHQHVSMRMDLCQQMAFEYGFDYKYPMLDIRLMEFYYSLPKEYKRADGWGRLIHRKAMQGILPEKLQWRDDKTGATVPHVYKRILKDEKAIRELINNAKEKGIGSSYIDYNKMDTWTEKIFRKQKRDNNNFPHHPGYLNYLKLILYLGDEASRKGL